MPFSNPHADDGGMQSSDWMDGHVAVTQFYYTHALPYLIREHREEIYRRLQDVPVAFRQSELAPAIAPLGETGGDVAWQVFRTYLDKVEGKIAEIVRGHSPGFWFHLHRRLRPMLSEVHEGKTDDTTVLLVRRIAELAYAKHGDLGRTDDLGLAIHARLETFLDGAWYEAKSPILIPSMDGLMVDLGAMSPFLHTLFFGLRKVSQAGGEAFEESVRSAIQSRALNMCFQGELRWSSGNPREVDAAVRIGDRLVLIECFSYELPLDYEIGKPSVFERRKEFILEKVDQARSLAERIAIAPKGTNFDFSWAKEIDWRVVSPFVEFAWHLKEPLYDATGLPRVLQVSELLNNLTDGEVPAKRYAGKLKKFRAYPFEGKWY